MTEETANTTALLQIDLISHILRLSDCGNNYSNCGQVGDKAMIVDFLIYNQKGYVNADILEKFYQEFSEFEYVRLMGKAVKAPNDFKLDVVKKSMLEWKLLESIEPAESEIEQLVKRFEGKLEFKDDLQQYVQDLTVDYNRPK